MNGGRTGLYRIENVDVNNLIDLLTEVRGKSNYIDIVIDADNAHIYLDMPIGMEPLDIPAIKQLHYNVPPLDEITIDDKFFQLLLLSRH